MSFEHPKRTLAKTVTWRVIALFTTTVVVYAYSGDVKESVVIGLVANLLKMFLYYAHERVWNRIGFGRMKQPEYNI